MRVLVQFPEEFFFNSKNVILLKLNDYPIGLEPVAKLKATPKTSERKDPHLTNKTFSFNLAVTSLAATA